MTASSLPIARIHGVTKRYGNVVALSDVNLDLGTGVTALLGPNGAGKTTTVKLVLGLARPSSGIVVVCGGDPRRSVTRERIGAMLQVGRVPESLRVGEHIDLFRHYYPNPLPAAAVLAAAGLTQLANRRFGELSGGERQRVLFALALCGDPALLVLDEPTVGFDIETRRAFWDYIAAFARSGRSVLLATHYLEEADALADRIVVIDRGHVVADGTPSAIKSQSAAKVVRCTTSLSIDELEAIAGVRSARMTNGRAELLVGVAEAVVRDLLARDAGLADLEVVGAGLEEAFLTITRAADPTAPPTRARQPVGV